MDTLTQLMVDLKQSREQLEKMREQIKDIEKNPIYEQRKTMLENIDALETQIRAEGMNEIENLRFGLKVREISAISYPEQEAMTWALEHKMFLQLDKRGFEKFAKDNPPPFVTVLGTKQITIPKEIVIEETGSE